MRPTSLRFFTICMILFLIFSVTLYLGTRTPSVRDPLASAETTDYPSPSSSPDSPYRKAGGALLHRLRREVGIILGNDGSATSRKNGEDGGEREQVSLMHVRGVIPTQYYMRKRSALSPIITQAIAQVTATRRAEGEPQLMATSSPIVDVSIVDVAYAGISNMKDDNDEETKKALVDKGAVVLDSLEWSIGKKLLTEKQRNNFMSMNPDDTIWSPTLANVLQAAHRYQGGLDNADGAFVLYTGPLVTFGPNFYKVIGNILSNSSINSIAFRSGQNQDWLGFVFPVAWIPYLQFAGVLIDGPSKPIGELFCYNLEILSKGMGRFVRKNYQAIHLLSDEDSLVSDHTSQLAAAWQQIQSADAYWALHPNQIFSKYSKGLEPRKFCPCGNQKDSCPHDLERFFDTQPLAQELHRACQMAEAMLKDNTEKAPFKISAELHPSFAFGDFRDFRNLDSCSEKFAGFRKGLPKVGFVSYPRSGNTWTRRILERATSVLTGAVYDDQLLKDGGLLGEGRMNDVLMVKDHWPFDFSGGKKVLGWAEKIVWIVRNPFKSIESYYHYFYSGYRHSVSSSIDRQKWREWVTKESKAWVDWQKKWLSIAEENKVPILRVSYENLVDNPVDEVRRILEFIDFEVNEEKIGCAVQTNCKVNCRVGKNATAAVDIYGPEETEIMMKNIGDFMKQFGYEGKPVKKKR